MSRRYSLSRKEGWRQYVDDPPRERPHRLTRKEIAGLGEQARQEYHELRAEWHANLPIVRTPQLDATHGTLDEIVSSNRHDGERVRRVAAIDALPGLGKSTIANSFARAFDREQIRRHGSLANDGNERIPVVRVGLSANTTLRSLNERICEFYGHPAARRRSSNAEHLAAFALDCILSCDTELAVIDDIHRIPPRRRDGMDVVDHLKYLNSEFPITFVYAGVGLVERGFFNEGASGAAALLAQTGRRWTRLEVPAFELISDAGRRYWRSLLKATEQNLVLADARPTMLTSLGDYLFDRTTGHIGSFFSLINTGCHKAIAKGTERLTRSLLDTVRIDEASEQARSQLAAQIATRRSSGAR